MSHSAANCREFTTRGDLPVKRLCVPRGQALTAVLWSLVALSAGAMAGAADGERLFVTNCAPCHGKDGKARTPAARKLGVKDLSLSKLTDAEIVQQILEGKQDLRLATKMPSFKDRLTPADLQFLVPVVKSFRKEPRKN